MCERWDEMDRASDAPYFGWLCNQVAAYQDSIHLKLSVQTRPPGLTPLFFLEPTDHPLAIDQLNGISIARWHELVHQILHR